MRYPELAWVEQDTGAEYATDPLGLSLVADRLASRLLPGLTGTTQRARYYSFLCWAVRQTRGSEHPTRVIHRLEAELALEEAELHGEASVDECPGVVGRRTAATYLKEHNGQWPLYPERLYTATAFAAYRPSMRALGLLEQTRRPELTVIGEQLAAAFSRKRGPRPRCLRDVSTNERGIILRCLGLRGVAARNRDPAKQRRFETYHELKPLLGYGLTSAEILERYYRRPVPRRRVAWLLHQACAWECLSVGLTAAFRLLLDTQSVRHAGRMLRTALVGRPSWPGLAEPVPKNWAYGAVAQLRAALRLDLPGLGLDTSALALARRLVIDRKPQEFLRDLVSLHRAAKIDHPWIMLTDSDRVVRAPGSTRNLDFQVEARTYRLGAFGQILRDLDRI